MQKFKIAAATKNRGKLRELVTAFADLPVSIVPLDDFGELPDAVEDGATFEANALIKAKFYADLLKMPALADDSGLTVAALNGLPGVHSARFAGYHGSDEDNNKKLVAELKRVGATESEAAYECVLAFAVPENFSFGGKKIAPVAITAGGRCTGTIRLTPQGSGGFGYDPYFYFDSGRTMAEITPEEKNAISHRGAAIRAMRPKLANYLREQGVITG